MTKFKKWNSIQQFHEVIKNLNYISNHDKLREAGYIIPYGFKQKIHGTNACVRIDDKVTAQKRSSDIDTENDNYGFAAWVESRKQYFEYYSRMFHTMYIYGEWAGPGIQDNVACSKTTNRMFYVFSIDIHNGDELYKRIYDPEAIESLLGKDCPDDIIVLPWHSKLEIDFQSKEATESALASLNSVVEAEGTRDTFFWSNFEIDGPGEGLVAYPMLGRVAGEYQGSAELLLFSIFNFKAKAEAHRVNKKKTAVSFDPDKFRAANIFADAYCTEQRFQQAFVEGVSSEKNIRLMSTFIQWVVSDIHKESKSEVEDSDLEWKSLSKVCSTRAACWYKAQCESIS